jgi:hypothetical protein
LRLRSGLDPVHLLCDAFDKLHEYAGLEELCFSLRSAVEPYGITVRFPPGVQPRDNAELVELFRDDADDEEFGDAD